MGPGNVNGWECIQHLKYFCTLRTESRKKKEREDTEQADGNERREGRVEEEDTQEADGNERRGEE